MRKFNYLLLFGLLFIVASTNLFAQAKKYPLFEHFTQASCEPCASQNPYFSALYEDNESRTHHIAYHTSWPGVDPMYNANTVESNEMVGYYGVSGVPDMYLDGDGIGSPVAATQLMIDEAVDAGSPISIRVEETTSGTTRTVTIEIKTEGSVPAGTFKLKAAVVEKMITYAFAPGSNGEKEFPNVFREFLAGSGGETITIPATGSSTTITYSYELSGTWNADEIYVLAWVQNSATKDILNSGASNDSRVDLTASGTDFVHGTAGTASAFNGEIENISNGTTNAEIVLSGNMPADWSASYTINGSTYTGSTTVSIAESDLENITVNVTPGATPELSEIILQVYNADNAASIPATLRYYVISGITDLVVNNEAPYGNGNAYGSYDFAEYIPMGLDLAGNTTYTSTSDIIMKKGLDANALNYVKYIYYNVAWTFPSITPDETDGLEEFLDNGGRLFIAGQDIGWEIMDPGSFYLDPATESFYTNYLHAGYVTDAASGATQLTPVPGDPYFATTGYSTIKKNYGPTYYFPDQLEVIDAYGSPIFYYNDTETKVAGIRAEKDDYKVVYLGIGVEMIMDVDVRSQVMKLVHDYFREGITGIEFDNAMQALLGNIYPNPASQFATIELQNIDKPMDIVITDISGKIMLTQPICVGTEKVQIETAGLKNGLYLYYVTDGINASLTRKLEIIK